MKYILDFDHTLFDTARFVHDAQEYKKRGEMITPEIWDRFDAKQYLFDDVIPFLEKVGKDQAQILTAITPALGPLSSAFQEAKLHKSGIGVYVRKINFVIGDKGQSVAMLYDGTPTTFIDNMLHQVQSVKQACPDVSVLQILRPDPFGLNELDATDLNVSSITSLYEIIH